MKFEKRLESSDAHALLAKGAQHTNPPFGECRPSERDVAVERSSDVGELGMRPMERCRPVKERLERVGRRSHVLGGRTKVTSRLHDLTGVFWGREWGKPPTAVCEWIRLEKLCEIKKKFVENGCPSDEICPSEVEPAGDEPRVWLGR